MLEYPQSPLFPASSLAFQSGNGVSSDVLLPQLPEHPLVLTSSLQVYIVPAEKHLFVQGFKPAEFEGLPPTLLRGCVVVRVLKATKLRSISLLFKGIQRTDWPEGIPPKKNLYVETNDIVAHTWPFYQMENQVPNCGADLYVPGKGQQVHEDVSHLNLAELHTSSMQLLAPIDSATSFAASLIKRATSPLSGGSAAHSNSLAPSDSMADLTAVLSTLSLATMGESLKPGYFAPGDYVYNFEHPLPALSPESTLVNFGKVSYNLETTIARIGTFKSNLTGRIPINVVRIPSENSVEENEPIVIERDWEDQLRYEIVVGSKAIVLDSYVPLVFRFIPLYGKVSLHRIRVYLTESCNYYCHNKTVHREEPVKKFLLLEHKAVKNKSLLLKSGGLTDDVIENDEVLPRELEFQLYVPSMINKKYNYSIHPDTSFDNIKCDHWIKISLRISKQDPDIPQKRKHFEILIDSPVHLCSPLAAHCNTLLPAYDTEPEFLPKYTPNSPPMSPEVTAINHIHHNPGHLILSALSNIGGNNSSSSAPPLRPVTPIEFKHITSSQNNNEPIERDNNVHLEANLYQPEEPEVLDALGSPQAKPFSPVASPLMLPKSLGSSSVRARNNVSQAPSMNPPAFEEVSVPIDQSLPPAYFREDPALSLSPLRIDQPLSEGRSTSGTLSKNIPPVSILDQLTTSIKSMLSRQLDRRDKSSFSDRDSVKSNPSAHSKKSLDADDKNSLESRNSMRQKESRTSESSCRSNERENLQEMQNSDHSQKESDAVKLAKEGESSTVIPHTANILLQQTQTIGSHDDDYDIADIRADIDSGAFLRVDPAGNGLSRKSSISLATLSMNDIPLDQTLPLLSLSSTSVNDTDRLLFDGNRRPSMMSSMGDLLDATVFGNDDFNINGSLFMLRNPRIKKHYQDRPMDEVVEALTEEKPRQKSFGVIPQLTQLKELNLRSRGLTGSSDGSEMTVSAIDSPNGSKGDTYVEPVDLQEVASQ